MVSGFNHLEKYSSMGRIIPYIMETKKCSKPPTRFNSWSSECGQPDVLNHLQ